MPAQADSFSAAPFQPAWQRKAQQQAQPTPAQPSPTEPSSAPVWLPQPGSAPGSNSQTPRWTSTQPQGPPATSAGVWGTSQQPQQQQQWQGGGAGGSNPVSPRPAWPPFQPQPQPQQQHWQGQSKSPAAGSLPSPRPAWQGTGGSSQQQHIHAEDADFDPEAGAGPPAQPSWQTKASFPPTPTYSAAPAVASPRPAWGQPEPMQQPHPHQNGDWTSQGDAYQENGTARGDHQMQDALPMDNASATQMDWQQGDQWTMQPDQVSSMPACKEWLTPKQPLHIPSPKEERDWLLGLQSGQCNQASAMSRCPCMEEKKRLGPCLGPSDGAEVSHVDCLPLRMDNARQEHAEQVQSMEQSEDLAFASMYDSGYPEVGFDQDAPVHLKEVKSHIAALKVLQLFPEWGPKCSFPL